MRKLSKKQVEEMIEEYQWMIDRLKRGLPRSSERVVKEIEKDIEWYENKITILQGQYKVNK